MASADHDLLLGLLALQDGLIDQAQLVDALQSWIRDRDRSLAEYLAGQGGLDAEKRDAIEALVTSLTRTVEDDPGQGLDTVATGASTGRRPGGRTDPESTDRLSFEGPGTEGPTTLADREATLAVGPSPADGQRYRVLSPYARGGLGAVFVALDTEFNREVALKQILGRWADDPAYRRRFLVEAEITGRLEHPGVVPVYSLGHDDRGRPYYAMRFIRGITLREAIVRFHATGPATDAGSDHPDPDDGTRAESLDPTDPMDPARRDPPESATAVAESERGLELRRLLRRFLDACNAVDYAHSRGVLHRDLKPGNVMLGSFGETIVVDWGLAKDLRDPARASGGEAAPGGAAGRAGHGTLPGSVLGTPAFMSPEQAAGAGASLDARSDVYGLGATLYCLLTGLPPFSGPTETILERVRAGAFRPPRRVDPRVDPALEAICLKAMALRPEGRYPSCRALADDIERWAADEPVSCYREPATKRFSRWSRRHRTAVTAIAAALAVATLAIGYVLSARAIEHGRRVTAARARVDALLAAEVRALPALLEQIGPDRALARGRLESLAGDAPGRDDRRRFPAALALLPDDPGQFDFLAAYATRADATPDEVLVIRGALAGHPGARALASTLIGELGGAGPGLGDEGLRRAGVLAGLAGDDPIWEGLGVPIAEKLVGENALLVGGWREVFQPVASRLLGALSTIFADRSRPAARAVAYELLVAFAERPGNPARAEELAALLLEADPDQAGQIRSRLSARGDRDRVAAALSGALAPVAQFDDALVERQGRAAVALMTLGETSRPFELLSHLEDPGVRTEIIHEAARRGVPAAIVADRLRIEPEVSRRRALVLLLGQYAVGGLDGGLRAELAELLLGWYEADPDPGLHGAVGWLLGVRWGLGDRLEAIDRDLASPEIPTDRGWFVNPIGQTYSIVPGPVRFAMGSTEATDPDRESNERYHEEAIPRSFAIAAREVSLAEYGRYLDEAPEGVVDFRESDRVVVLFPSPDCAAGELTWYDAARYCNWLSRREGLPESDWCYPPDIGPGVPVPPGHLERPGYRLPTEAEWEYACRAGASSSRFYGGSAARLGSYAWYAGPGTPSETDAGGVMHPVGTKMPNDLGLFDVLGNAFEWCDDEFPSGPAAPGPPPGVVSRAARSGAFNNDPQKQRSASHITIEPGMRVPVIGLRPARTIRRMAGPPGD